MVEKTEQQAVLFSGPDELPRFQRGEKRGLLLNLRLDVEMDGVTYHLTSVFDGKREMGEVIDTIELERNLRQTA